MVDKQAIFPNRPAGGSYQRPESDPRGHPGRGGPAERGRAPHPAAHLGHARRRVRRHGAAEGRVLPAQWLVQVPRRVQPAEPAVGRRARTAAWWPTPPAITAARSRWPPGCSASRPSWWCRRPDRPPSSPRSRATAPSCAAMTRRPSGARRSPRRSRPSARSLWSGRSTITRSWPGRARRAGDRAGRAGPGPGAGADRRRRAHRGRGHRRPRLQPSAAVIGVEPANGADTRESLPGRPPGQHRRAGHDSRRLARQSAR